jgi:hypothetical protein
MIIRSTPWGSMLSALLLTVDPNAFNRQVVGRRVEFVAAAESYHVHELADGNRVPIELDLVQWPVTCCRGLPRPVT